MRRAPFMSRSVGFSVIIPTYNRLDFIQQAVKSIEAQSHGDYEIIVVDDGSTDGTADYLASLGTHVKALHQANKGPAAARNLGVQHSLGTYIAFLDSDDFWFPWALATFHEVIRRYRAPSLISAAHLEFKEEVPNLKQEMFAAKYFVD